MTKLIDKLRTVGRGDPGRIGFGSSSSRKAPGIGLLADVGADLSLARDAAAIADAVILRPAPDAQPDLPGIWGVDVVEDSTAVTGADFFVVTTESDTLALRAEESGRLLRLSVDAPDSMVQAVSALPVDALIASEHVTGRLTVAQLLDYLRLSTLARRPLILGVTSTFAMDQLVSLRDVGVAAVCVNVSTSDDLDALRTARAAIDTFPMLPKRDRPREALIASIAAPAAPAPPSPAEPDDPDDD